MADEQSAKKIETPEYQVLARKYRPQTLEDVLGQDHVTTTLRNAISGDRVAHAYLFTGARGVGKTSSARILAKALNCAQGPTITPCKFSGIDNDPSECENCREIRKGISPDVFEIDAASNTGVDNVRELQEGLRYMPGKSKHKIYIIDEVHMLSGSAFNALLKTLEEPPKHVRFIFATTEPHKIPVTILSRCQRFDFKRLSRQAIVDSLRKILDQEKAGNPKLSYTESALQILAHEAEGSMRDALSLTDQALSFGGTKLDDASVTSALGVIDRKVLTEAVRGILHGDGQRLLEIVDQVYDFGYDVRQFTKNLLEHFRNLLVVRVTRDASRLVDLPAEDIEELRREGADVPIDRLHRLFSSLLKLSEDVGRSSHPRMVLEIGLVRVGTLGPLQPVEELLGRIRDLGLRPPPIAGGLAGPVPQRLATPQPRAPRPEPVRAAPMIERAEPPRPAPVAPTPAAAAPAPAPKPAAPAAPAEPGSGSFVDFIRGVNSKLADQIAGAKLSVAGDKLTIALPVEKGFLLPMLQLGGVTELAKHSQGFYGRRLQVDVRLESGGYAPPEPKQADRNKRRTFETPADKDRKRDAVNHPAVQEVLRVFDSGRIVDVHLLADAALLEQQTDSNEQE